MIKDVPRSVLDRDERLPFIVHGLLQHEHKQSVLHFVVQRNTEYDEPVKAKVRVLSASQFFLPLPPAPSFIFSWQC